MTFTLADLKVPLVGAPMAGGPTTPALAAAVSNAGGLGFLAAGYLPAQRLATDLHAARSASTQALGVNLFVPQASVAAPEKLLRYRGELTALAERFGVEVGPPRFDDDGWSEKLEVIADLRPEVVSFTFALPQQAVLQRLRGLGMSTMMTVTSADEAAAAVAQGVDAVVVQGPEAGGHRANWNPTGRPPEQSLSELLAAVRGVVDVPIIAAGGLGGAGDVASVLAAGVAAAQVGTALLLADEAGTNPVHRAALISGDFTETAITRAFSGRFARGLRNDFMRRFDDLAPAGYPEVHYMTSPIRRAAVAAGDPAGTNLWAGTNFAAAAARPAADVIAGLTP